MTRPTCFALVCAPALLLGCGYVDVHEVFLGSGPRPHAARPTAEVYLTNEPPRRGFDQIALLQVVGYGSRGNLEDTMNALTQRAADLGCDAVVNAQFDVGATMAHAFGACVVWTSAERPAPPPLPASAPLLPPSPKAPAP